MQIVRLAQQAPSPLELSHLPSSRKYSSNLSSEAISVNKSIACGQREQEWWHWGHFPARKSKCMGLGRWLSCWVLTVWPQGLAFRSPPLHKAGVPHKLVAPAPTGPETGVSLGLPGCQPARQLRQPEATQVQVSRETLPQRNSWKLIEEAVHCPPLATLQAPKGTPGHTRMCILKLIN